MTIANIKYYNVHFTFCAAMIYKNVMFFLYSVGLRFYARNTKTNHIIEIFTHFNYHLPCNRLVSIVLVLWCVLFQACNNTTIGKKMYFLCSPYYFRTGLFCKVNQDSIFVQLLCHYKTRIRSSIIIYLVF